MGGKPSKATNDQGLVPRDGSDEIEIPSKKLVTQEQFDELMHKFTLLEQLMLRDKSKLSNLETSVTEYQQEKQKLRQSFVEIDSEVKREKEQRVRQESTLAEQLEERTREKYQLLDQMLNSQAQRIDQLIREQEEKSENLKLEYGQLDQKLTTSLRVERTEVEKLVETRLKEDGREKVLEKRVSKLIDDNSLSLSTVQQELDARKRETQEVRESVQRQRDALLQEISRVQEVLKEAKQANESSDLSEQLTATKQEFEGRLGQEEAARDQLELFLKTMLDNKVSENQNQVLEKIRAQEESIQSQLLRMEELRANVDKKVKEEQNKVLESVESRISEISVNYEKKLTAKEEEKTQITRKLSEDFQHKLQQVQSDFNNDLQMQKSRTESIMEDSGNEKATVQQRLDAMEENVLEKLEMAQKQNQTSLNSELFSLREELNSVSKSTTESLQQSGVDLSGLKDQLIKLVDKMKGVEEGQNTAREEMESFQNTYMIEMDAKVQLIVEAKLSNVKDELDQKISVYEKNCTELSEKVDAIGTSHEPEELPSFLEYRQKTDEDIGTLLDRMEERHAQLQSVSEYMSGIEEAHKKTQETVQSEQEKLQSVESELSLLQEENKALTDKLETRAQELSKAVEDNDYLKQSLDKALRMIEENNKSIKQLQGVTEPNRQSLTEIPPESPMEKIEDLDVRIRKQSHGMNDLEYLIDEARSSAKESTEFVENAIFKFESKLEVSHTLKL
eukprot:TRINITY_DN751_c0_g1_i1.p2 TRINITY_DN751_c0_g1~~TRINITY_DN751_c0_g1_i1.p2  ORF type:complete len:733 (+),score=235.64 TRINITY_DN751_c0_g1_i1:38-2236(+)